MIWFDFNSRLCVFKKRREREIGSNSIDPFIFYFGEVVLCVQMGWRERNGGDGEELTATAAAIAVVVVVSFVSAVVLPRRYFAKERVHEEPQAVLAGGQLCVRVLDGERMARTPER